MSETLLTAAQMRAVERAAIESGAVTGLELMERAGRGAVDAILAEWPYLAAAPGRAVVLCGPGNNGGDGFVVARLLKDRGWEVEVFLYGDPGKLPPDAQVNYGQWGKMGVVRELVNGILREDEEARRAEGVVWIDALFGTGIGRPLEDPALQHATRVVGDLAVLHDRGARVVALDAPSGLDLDSGRFLRSAEREAHGHSAHLTVTFHSLKIGHVTGPEAACCGRVVIADIGLPSAEPSECARCAAPYAGRLAKVVTGHHKYDHGHALVITGGMGRTGAARLAARGALRIGAGLVTLGAPGSAMMECAAQITALMLRRCGEPEDLTELLEDARINALCLGPGLGTDDRAAGLVAAALAAGRVTVLDADALTLIAGDPALMAALHDKCLLTPHGGEFARLFPDLSERLIDPAETGPAYSKVDATRDAAARASCTVLFKGPDTVIADPSGRAAINAAVYDRAAPWLATAGAGDVLAGMIAGLLARGLAPKQAAEAAAWCHVEAARAFGPGLIAEDLPEMLPKVLARLSVGE
ncbi:MAG: NAD(P)H-hydrate dehydratase [Pseudomonadota bacterium]